MLELNILIPTISIFIIYYSVKVRLAIQDTDVSPWMIAVSQKICYQLSNISKLLRREYRYCSIMITWIDMGIKIYSEVRKENYCILEWNEKKDRMGIQRKI